MAVLTCEKNDGTFIGLKIDSCFFGIVVQQALSTHVVLFCIMTYAAMGKRKKTAYITENIYLSSFSFSLRQKVFPPYFSRPKR